MISLSSFSLLLLLTTFGDIEMPDSDLHDKSIKEIAILINHEVGNAEADDISQCNFMPIGVKPAGGPWGYLIYSSKNTDTQYLKKLVDRYNELDAESNVDEGLMSTGDFALEPELEIVQGECRGVGLYAWNPGYILNFNDIEIQ